MIFSARHGGAKVALAGEVEKLPQGVVMHVLQENAHEKLERGRQTPYCPVAGGGAHPHGGVDKHLF